jgi:hypothetical protein
LTLLLLTCAALAADAQAEPLAFTVTVSPDVMDEPFTGRVVVWLSRNARREPRFGPNWFAPEPCYSAKFENVKPGEPMTVTDANAVGFPGKLSELEAGQWTIQAVADRNLGGRTVGRSPGNLYSAPQPVQIDPNDAAEIKLVCDQVVREKPFVETESVKLVKLRSKLLSDHYGRDTYMRAAVVLPKEWHAEPSRKFPVIYQIPGFGGTHEQYSGLNPTVLTVKDGVSFLIVELDPSCPTGHCVFADSDNNGPWGTALVTELIPHIETKHRAIAQPGARFVTGHSSGGWSSLWLQVTYPDFFGGTWSTSPDPVDFRDWQQVDLYKPGQNLFTDEQGNPRPIARRGDRPFLYYKQFTQMEQPIRGEQIGSFEAVFGKRRADGEPDHLYDRETGAIDPRAVESWSRYDIGRTLRENWKSLAPKLAGKLHVYMGDTDTFYLEGAVKLLKKDLADLGSDATVELVPGDHGSMMTPTLRQRIEREMAEQFREWERRHQATTRKAA